MDKRKVLEAHRQGSFTLQECSQILGIHPIHLENLLKDARTANGTPLEKIAGKRRLGERLIHH